MTQELLEQAAHLSEQIEKVTHGLAKVERYFANGQDFDRMITSVATKLSPTLQLTIAEMVRKDLTEKQAQLRKQFNEL